MQGRRTRSRDDLMDLERGRGGGGRDVYDDGFLREAMERKKMGEQQRARSRERLDSDSERSDRYRGGHGGPPPLPLSRPAGNPDQRRANNAGFPPPPSYTEDTDSLASSKKSNLRKVRSSHLYYSDSFLSCRNSTSGHFFTIQHIYYK